MRDSGVPWLGQVPVHWNVTRLKFHLKGITQGWSPQCDVLPAGPDDWGVLKAGCVNGNTFNADENKRLPDRETPLPEIEVHPRDVVISRANTTELVGSAAIAPADVRPRLLLSDKLYRLEVSADELMPEFLVYFLRTPSGRFNFERTASGASNSMQNISQDVVRNLWLPVPPTSEQRAIVARLARDTAPLDTLVAAKQRILELLAEKRKSIIATAVTRGLDPSVKLRDSGVPWLGEIPAHWDFLKFSWCVSIAEGQVDPEDEEFSSWPLIAPNHIESGTGRLLALESAFEQGAISGKYQCHPGDVIYSKIRPALRKATIAPQACLCSADMYPMRVDGSRLISEYLLHYLLTDAFSVWAVLESNRVAMPKINRESLIELRMPVPPIEEQGAIVDYIARETTKLDAVRAATERTITLLKERRSALIAAAVTGQLDVGAAA